MEGKQFLLIDEISMCNTATLSKGSAIMGRILTEQADASKPFGGMNVVILGDFHQFPPPTNPHGALYSSHMKTEVRLV